MMFEDVEEVWFPDWAYDRTRPRFGAIRRGVLYTVHPDILALLLNESQRPYIAWGAIGPRIFFGRDPGPYVPYNVATEDENLHTPVFRRAWPWCWGDEIWAVATWQNQPLFLHWAEPDTEGRVFLFPPGTWDWVKKTIETKVKEATTSYAQELPPKWWNPEARVEPVESPVKKLLEHWKAGRLVVAQGADGESIRTIFEALEDRYT